MIKIWIQPRPIPTLIPLLSVHSTIIQNPLVLLEQYTTLELANSSVPKPNLNLVLAADCYNLSVRVVAGFEVPHLTGLVVAVDTEF